MWFRVSFVLRLLDDFDGSLLPGGEQNFSVNGRPVVPIRKPEGFYVFTDLPKPCTVQIRSARFQAEEISIPAEQEAEDIVIVRMIRKHGLFSADCDWKRGWGPPGKRVFALVEYDPALQIQAMEETKIRLAGYTARPLQRLGFILGGGTEREPVILTEKLPDGTYTLQRPPQRKYPAGTHLFRAYAGLCDESGDYAIPLPKGEAQRILETGYFREGVEEWVSLSAAEPR